MMTTPVTIVCGFLGAGKSTLLNHLLRDPGGERLGVVVNDFGAINIDKDLIKIETSDQIELSNGCVCCSVREDLASGLVALSRIEPQFSRIIVECSGVSNPVGVLGIFDLPAVETRYHVDGVFCLVDCDSFDDLDFKSTELAIDQAAYSDIVLLNKVDLADNACVLEISRTLRGAQPHMRICQSIFANVPRDVLFSPRLETKGAAGTKNAQHNSDYISLAFTWDHPLTLAEFGTITSALPHNVMRAKGILRVVDPSSNLIRRAVYNLVGKRSSIELQETGDESTSRIVFIGRSGAFEEEAIRAAVNLHPGAQEVFDLRHSDHEHHAKMRGDND